MDLTTLLLQLVIAIVCAGIANILIPRQIPGKGVGLVLIGLTGVFIGQWFANYLRQQYGISLAIFEFKLQGVPIVPSIIGSVIVLYVVTAVIAWGYSNR